jgi:ribosomal protein S18 acetylase RimI-like enzyme
MTRPTIALCTPVDIRLLTAHLDRHFNESGQRATLPEHSPRPLIFHPLDDDHRASTSENFDRLRAAWTKPTSAVGWSRVWAAFTIDSHGSRSIVAHAQLDGSPLQSGLHRAVFSIGVEASYRGLGLGGELMDLALRFARDTHLSAVVLRAFEHNHAAERLYVSRGFVKLSTLPDSFRIRDQKITDCTYCLNLETPPLQKV